MRESLGAWTSCGIFLSATGLLFALANASAQSTPERLHEPLSRAEIASLPDSFAPRFRLAEAYDWSEGKPRAKGNNCASLALNAWGDTTLSGSYKFDADMMGVYAIGHESFCRLATQLIARNERLTVSRPVGESCAAGSWLVIPMHAHSSDRGHPFQADRGQRSGRSRTPVAGVLSDDADGRPTVRHQFGTPSAISVERGLPGCPRGAPGAGWATRCRRLLAPSGDLLGSLVHGGGGACDAWPPRWTRRGHGAVRSDRQGCRQACALALRSDSPFSAMVCEPCSSLSMMASAMVGSLSH